jgi:toxin ParE1/3/4
MNQYRVSAEARSDLDEVWLHIANDNSDAADKYIRAIVSRFAMLASMPHLGRARPELSPGLRSFVVGHHVIFYRLFDGGVEVARVLDGVRDLPPLFE